MEWLARRMEEIPGDGTTEAQLDRFLLSFHRHIAMDVLDLWEDRNTMLAKHREEVQCLTLASLRQEVAEEEAAVLVEDTAILLLVREGNGEAAAEARGASVGADRRVGDSWSARLALGPVYVGSITGMEEVDRDGGGGRSLRRV